MDGEAIVDRIYEAAVLPECWPQVIALLARRVGALGGSIFVSSEGATRWLACERMRPVMSAYVEEGWIAENPRVEKLVQHGRNRFIHDLMVFRAEEMEALGVYARFLHPRGLGWTAATVVPTLGDDMMVLSIDRARAEGPFDDAAMAWLDSMRAHIARAALIAARLQLQNATGLAETLDRVGIPAAVIGSQARIVARNDAFARLGPQLRTGAFGRLGLADARAGVLLAEALAAAGSRQHPGVCSIAVPALEDHPAFVLHVAPVARAAGDIFSPGRVLAVASTLERRAPADGSVLEVLYDLTPAESRIAAALLGGMSVDAIAAAFGNSRETIRSHLKRVFAKTGSSGQADLVSRLALLPVPRLSG